MESVGLSLLFQEKAAGNGKVENGSGPNRGEERRVLNALRLFIVISIL